MAAASRLHRARERRASGATLIEGPNVIAEAIAANVPIRELFVLTGDAEGRRLGRQAGVEPTLVEPAVLQRLAGTATPRGPIAVIAIPPPTVGTRDAVVLDVTDPGNAGTILRAAAAFCFDVVARAGSVDLWAPKVVRAGAGAHFRTAICGEGPSATIATVVAGGISSRDLASAVDPGRTWSVLVGSEAHGLSSDVVDSADVKVSIPMPGGIESLNASVAASIVMYELTSVRRSHGVA